MIKAKKNGPHNFFCCWCDRFHQKKMVFEIYDNFTNEYFLMCEKGVIKLVDMLELALEGDKHGRERGVGAD